MARIEISLEKGRHNHYYTYRENIFVCPMCKKTYKSIKICWDCTKKLGEKIFNIETINIYEGSVRRDYKNFNCNCIFGSFFRWSNKFRKSNKFCQHAIKALRKIKNNEDNENAR